MPRVARGPWSQSSRPCCGLLRRPQLVRAVFSAAGRVVGLGVSFLKRSLRARPAPAACFIAFRRRASWDCFVASRLDGAPAEKPMRIGRISGTFHRAWAPAFVARGQATRPG